MAMALIRNAGVTRSVTRPELPPLAPSCSSLSSRGVTRAASASSSSRSKSGRLCNSGAESGLVGSGAHLGRQERGATGRVGWKVERRVLSPLAALVDPHSFAFLADIDWNAFDTQLDPSKFPVRIDLDPTRVIVEERLNWQLGEEGVKTFYMVWALVFSWGCCVFGSMNDKFYESDDYRNAGGNGTGHWIYEMEEREERAARQEMWSEDLMKEIEEKAEEVRKAEEKAKERELV